MKRVFSFLLVLLLVVGLMPVQAMADEFDDIFGNGDDNNPYVLVIWMTEDNQPAGDGYSNIEQSAGTPVDLKDYVPAGYKIVRTEVEGDTSLFTVDGNWCFTMPDAPGEILVIVAQADGGSTPQPPQQPTPYNVYVRENIANGTISVDKSTAYTDDTVTITVAPDSGYRLSWITIYNRDADGVEYAPVSLGNNVYSFTVTDCNIFVDGGFEPDNTPQPTLYNVTVNTTGNGTASADKTQAAKGETVTVTATPDAGYEVENIVVTDANNNNVVFSNGAFVMPESDATVTVSFVPEVEKIRVNFDANGGSCDTTFVQLNMGAKIELLPTATREGYIMTGWYTSGGTKITTDTVFNESATVYAHWVSAAHTTNPGGNAFYGDLAMRDEEVLNLLLTPEDLASGEDIAVYMEVKNITGGSIPGKSAIDERAGDDKIAAYLDITLYKKIGSNAPVTIPNTGSKVTITLQLTDAVIPANAGRDTFYIIYYHDGVAKETVAYFDAASKTLSFGANEFSTYAIAYNPNRTYKVSFDANGGSGTMEAKQVNPGSFTLPSNGFTAPSGKEFSCWKVGGANKNPGEQISVTSDVTVTAVWKNKTSSGTLDKVPKTGDTTGLFGWMLLSLCGAATLAAVAVYDKKRAR